MLLTSGTGAPPPPPPPAGQLPKKASGSKKKLLSSIETFNPRALRQTVTNDRSAPIVWSWQVIAVQCRKYNPSLLYYSCHRTAVNSYMVTALSRMTCPSIDDTRGGRGGSSHFRLILTCCLSISSAKATCPFTYQNAKWKETINKENIRKLWRPCPLSSIATKHIRCGYVRKSKLMHAGRLRISEGKKKNKKKQQYLWKAQYTQARKVHQLPPHNRYVASRPCKEVFPVSEQQTVSAYLLLSDIRSLFGWA